MIPPKAYKATRTTRSLLPGIVRWLLPAAPPRIISWLSPLAHRTSNRTVPGSVFLPVLPIRRYSTPLGRFFRSSSSRNKPTVGTTHKFIAARLSTFHGSVLSFWSAVERNEILLVCSWRLDRVEDHLFFSGRGWAMGHRSSSGAVRRWRLLGKVDGLFLLSERLDCRADRLSGRAKLAGARLVVAFVLGCRYTVRTSDRRKTESSAGAVRRRSGGGAKRWHVAVRADNR